MARLEDQLTQKACLDDQLTQTVCLDVRLDITSTQTFWLDEVDSGRKSRRYDSESRSKESELESSDVEEVDWDFFDFFFGISLDSLKIRHFFF